MRRRWLNAGSSPWPSTPPYTGESSGEPRHVASPDINTEDFSAAVDFLTLRDDVDRACRHCRHLRMGRSGLNVAALDTRIKATVAVTMYDMSRVTANGYFDSMDADARYELRRQLNAQRTEDARTGSYRPGRRGGRPAAADAPQFVRDYYDYYKTPRGYHPRSLNSNGGWNRTSALSFLNTPLLAYAGRFARPCSSFTARRPIPATSARMPSNASRATTRSLMIIPGASHVDLYDRVRSSPFDRIESFFRENLQ